MAANRATGRHGKHAAAGQGNKALVGSDWQGSEPDQFMYDIPPLEPSPANRAPAPVRRRRRVPLFFKFVLTILLLAVVSVFAYAAFLDYTLAQNGGGDDVKAALSKSELGQPFYILLLGSDSREGSGTSNKPAMSGDQERSDVMILARVDPQNAQLTMLTIPRDTAVTLDDGRIAKINECYNVGGAAYSIRKVSELTGVPIHHYAEVHFSSLMKLIDLLGGVEVDVPIDMSYFDALNNDYVKLSAGHQTINGQQAQILARARHEYVEDQDANRQGTVRMLSTAILEKVLDRPWYEMPATIIDVAKCVGTDMRSIDLIGLAPMLLQNKSMTVYNGTGPYAGDIREDADGLWLCYDNPTGWQAVMETVDAGGDPSTVDVNAGAIVP